MTGHGFGAVAGMGDAMFENGRMIAVAGTSLYVAEAGRPDGVPVVLLHGGLGCRDDFAPLAAHLAGEYRLIAIDSRGHGRSALGPGALSYRRLEQDIAAVLTELGISGAGIIGHSDGGIVALRLAGSGSYQPGFVVAIGAHWHLPPDDPVRQIYQEITAGEWREMFAAQVERYQVENPAPDFDRLFDAVRAMWLGTGDDAYPGDLVRAITCPLLVVHGDDDFLVSRRQAFDLAEQVPGARLLNLPFASHTVAEDQPEDLLPALRQFIAGAA
ncbi:MAG: alpha/beta hydrolase [Paracoccus sp. (in: a-proteobacteria)]|uniref:alpha/beta fold hydrolase n=1 Tax=Paracoccus sp. TaxID=267 RepID=UPI0026DFE1A8|nr:alpha/beta hydrolase [Paracoccus sp. (in: a-proteobacteria)]MDO5633070.1 alpha/beta hydrolase [Paracoccus sp. (in: a-proteobacteria)]